MKFKKNPTYFKTFTKEETIEYLKSLDVVDNVRKYKNSIFITTIPIKPSNRGVPIRGFFKYPIGTFQIKIFQDNDFMNALQIRIQRKEGFVLNPDFYDIYSYTTEQHIMECAKTAWKADSGCETLHVEPTTKENRGMRICWGNIKEEVQRAKIERDWYWLSKLSLELVQDSHFELAFRRLSMMVFLAMQSDYVEKNYSKTEHNKFIASMKKPIKGYIKKIGKHQKCIDIIGGLKWLSR